jgi:hypothetical protein
LQLVGKQAALAILDHFQGQLSEEVAMLLEEHNIQSVLVPPSCTDRLQLLDISVNKAAKSFSRSEFQEWYADKLTQQLDSMSDEDEFENVDMSSL